MFRFLFHLQGLHSLALPLEGDLHLQGDGLADLSKDLIDLPDHSEPEDLEASVLPDCELYDDVELPDVDLLHRRGDILRCLRRMLVRGGGGIPTLALRMGQYVHVHFSSGERDLDLSSDGDLDDKLLAVSDDDDQDLYLNLRLIGDGDLDSSGDGDLEDKILVDKTMTRTCI